MKVGVITMTTVNRHITVMEAPCRLTAKAAGREKKKSKLDARAVAMCTESSMMKRKNKKREKENC